MFIAGIWRRPTNTCYKHGPPTEGGTSHHACYKHGPPTEGRKLKWPNSSPNEVGGSVNTQLLKEARHLRRCINEDRAPRTGAGTTPRTRK